MPNLLQALHQELGVTLLFVTRDLSAVRYVRNRVTVL